MVIAALVVFGALLVSWILAPDGRVAPATAAPESGAVPATA